MFQVPRSWVRRSWVNWCEKRAGLGERDAPLPFPDHARLTIVESGTGYSVEFSLVFQTASCSQIIQDTSSSVYSPSPAAVFVSSRNAAGEERLRDETQLLLWEATIQTSQTWIHFVGMHFGIESDTCRNIYPNYKLGISGNSEFYVSDWSNSITHSFVSYIISAAMIKVLLMMVKELKCKLLAFAHCDWVTDNKKLYVRLVTIVMAAAWRIGGEHESELKLS